MKLVMKLLEQAAKEVGGMYTTTHKLEHTGKNGGPIRWIPPSKKDLEEVDKIYQRVMGARTGPIK